jgi:hypothetical protein
MTGNGKPDRAYSYIFSTGVDPTLAERISLKTSNTRSSSMAPKKTAFKAFEIE